MSRWDRPDWFTRGPKQAPPEHGIKMKKAGSTWWGQRWIEALQHVLRGDSGRLARGRTYARAGRTHDLLVTAGKVVAKVTGSRPEPYEVSIELAPVSDAAWDAAIAGMAAKAQFSAELLAGQMPQAIDDVFVTAGSSLFPLQRSELHTHCSCPDWGDPCKHVAATHYVLGEAFDRDPFLLFELRGRSKTRVLDALRSARNAGSPRESRAAIPEPTSGEIPKVVLGKLAHADYDKPREALPALHFSFEAPHSQGAILKQLGAPAAWSGAASPADTLAPWVQAAAEAARRIALAEPEPPVSLEPERTQPRHAHKDQHADQDATVRKSAGKRVVRRAKPIKAAPSQRTGAQRARAKPSAAKPSASKRKRARKPA